MNILHFKKNLPQAAHYLKINRIKDYEASTDVAGKPAVVEHTSRGAFTEVCDSREEAERIAADCNAIIAELKKDVGKFEEEHRLVSGQRALEKLNDQGRGIAR
ncbi:hypothetical protein OPIT5_00025 (plasmid) [Opitutaceae bacterium TAV5]|nr:hypothetical protein OPIT5_00025 [Opitutaceae bacterium TAV5]